MKILLVEDSATLRYAMSTYIQEAGHTPVVAQSGEEALQMLEISPVDMIIMDVEMPGLNGFETTRLIREWLGSHWIPIIFVTGLNDDENYREGIEAGGDDYLIKPVSFMIIKAKIRAMERITEMRDQLSRLNANLAALSQLDSLTHIYNRRTFDHLAAQQWAQVKRHQQQPISALMIDVDHFKLYNDHYGHPAGDACLQKVSAAIKDALQRGADLLGRYGGEEFIVLLPETDAMGAFNVAQRIQENINALQLPHERSSTEPYVTVSIGGASCLRTASHSLEELVHSADRALYKVKHAGRNHALIDEMVIHKTLLIADPDAQNSQYLSELLQTHFNLLHCETHEECVDIINQVRPDLILLGEHLAITDEYQLCRALKRLPSARGIPVVLTSSTAQYPCDNPWGIKMTLDKEISGPILLNKIAELVT